MIVQFKGETRREAIINYFSLDIEEEEQYFRYIDQMGYSIDSEDEVLESLCDMMRKQNDL
jgi:hypothetical protein